MLVKRVEGERIFLSPYVHNDVVVETLLKWHNDPEFNHFILRQGKAETISNIEKWEQSHVYADNAICFLVYYKLDGTLIGRCDIIMKNRTTCEFNIVIGEKGYQGKGLGTELVELMISFVYKEVGCHKIQLSLNADNERAFKCYQKVGFKECGRYHEEEFYNGTWHDRILMEYLLDWYGK